MPQSNVIKMLQQLRATLAHALSQPYIGAKRFNDIRAQLAPLDQQLRGLGVDLQPIPQMSPSYVVPSRKQRRDRQKAGTYEQRVKRRLGMK